MNCSFFSTRYVLLLGGTTFFLITCAYNFAVLYDLGCSSKESSSLQEKKHHLERQSNNNVDNHNNDDQGKNKPLGLELLQRSYSDPASFSVMRTGIDELQDAYLRTIGRNDKKGKNRPLRRRLPRVVVSFTSTPGRFSRHGKEMIQLLKRQSYLPDTIYVAIPLKSRRSDNLFVIPKWMKNDPLVTLLRPKVDYGPATKLIPALEAEHSAGHFNTRIITVDDDNEGNWSNERVLELFAYSLAFPNAAIGLTGWNVTCMTSDARCNPSDSGIPERQGHLYNFIRASDDYACHSLRDWLPSYYINCMGAIRKNYIAFTDVIEGYAGALYQPRFFPNIDLLKSILDPDQTPEFFFLCDDVWLSGWLSVLNVPRILVNPAIHHDAPIRLSLVEASKQRNLPLINLEDATAAQTQQEAAAEPEPGLHSMGQDFVTANKEGVKWFEKKRGWTRDLWKKPPGFLYRSELLHGQE